MRRPLFGRTAGCVSSALVRAASTQNNLRSPVRPSFQIRSHATSATAKASTSAPVTDTALRTTLRFNIQDRVGALTEVLHELGTLQVSLTRIESRPSPDTGIYQFYVDFAARDEAQINEVVDHLASHVKELHIVSQGAQGMPWFPRKKSDMDTFAEKVMAYGDELDADHPGFTDPVYRARRDEITEIAKTYR
ncbi:hypothetical protein HKX48_001589 [Thoreauomyces humboldtii]|nr:hypothetical protein HKX48_001589 [Thoreauomyces humboldtii]